MILKKLSVIVLPVVTLIVICSSFFAAATEKHSKRGTGVTATGILNGKTITYEIINGLAIFEGDIILGRADSLNQQTTDGVSIESAVVISNGQFWPNAIIPYEISADFSASMITKINAAIQHWEDNTSINLIARNANNASLHPDYVQLRPGSGCSAQVGYGRGMRFIQLANTCGTGAIIHEIGHAAGLWHEQSREDRDNWVKINTANIQAGKEHNFLQHITDGDDLGPYDYDSIMHYGRNAFSANGLPTVEPINPPTAVIGQRGNLSAKDITAVETVYSNTKNIILSSGKCLDVHEPDFTAKRNGGLTQLWTCLNTNNQHWNLTVDGYLVMPNGMCLEVYLPDYNSRPNGGLVHQWQCNGQVNQRWSINEFGQLKSANGTCLDADPPQMNSNRGKIQTWSCNNSLQQTWSVQSKYKSLQNLWKTDQFLNIELGSITSSPIDPLRTSAAWAFQDTGNGYVRIRNLWKPNQYLHIENGVITAGNINPFWWSAQWKLIEVRNSGALDIIDGKIFRIQNRWKPEQHLHIENGVLDASAIRPEWWSAQWILSDL
jgi:Astacin (Peptidase family M12A)/Ricin-type beta-trefoil lectin domain